MSNALYRVITFLLLLLTWVVFSGLFDPFHLGLGVFSSLVVTHLSWRLLWTRPDLDLRTRLRQAVGFVGYIAWLLLQIVFSNLHILQLAFSPRTKVRPVMVHRRIKLKTDFARYVYAQSITLTPGTVTVKIDGDQLVIHAIDAKAVEGLDGSMERRIAAILEPEQLRAIAGGLA